MAARKTPFLSSEWRERIAAGVILDRLQKHAKGVIEMSPTQVRAAEILLRKCLPDLTSVHHTGEITTNVRAVEYSDDQLAAIATGRGAGVAQPSSGQKEPSSIH